MEITTYDHQTGVAEKREVTPRFDGATYDPKKDQARLSTQFIAVRDYVLKAYPSWVTLKGIAKAIGRPDAVTGVSARLRDMRKPRFGGFEVEATRLSDGVWMYRASFKQ